MLSLSRKRCAQAEVAEPACVFVRPRFFPVAPGLKVDPLKHLKHPKPLKPKVTFRLLQVQGGWGYHEPLKMKVR